MPLVSGQEPVADQEGITNVGPAVESAATVAPRKPTLLQTERWKAVQKARRKGMSLRAIERELGIHRSTSRNIWRPEVPRNDAPERFPFRQRRVAR